jgi:hypothetical protein
MADAVNWLQQNWYLAIPWALAAGAWLLARQRNVSHPVRWGLAFFIVGCAIVLAIDLTQM